MGVDTAIVLGSRRSWIGVKKDEKNKKMKKRKRSKRSEKSDR